MKPLNIIFFGSPAFSAEILESLFSTYNIVGLVTNPDTPLPTPVAEIGLKHHLPVFKPSRLDDAHLAHLKLLKPDLFLVVAYGKMIPPSYLTIPTLNVHFSLLPKYRGALCIQEAIKNQDRETGVTLMEMDAQMDHGPLISQIKIDIDTNDNVADLTQKLTQSAIALLSHPEILNLPAGRQVIKFKILNIQNDPLATYTPSLKTLTYANALIPWETIATAMKGINATKIHALIRSLNPSPGAHTTINGIDLKIIKTHITPFPPLKLRGGNPADSGKRVIQKLEINSIQLPGKKPITWNQFLSGHKIT